MRDTDINFFSKSKPFQRLQDDVHIETEFEFDDDRGFCVAHSDYVAIKHFTFNGVTLGFKKLFDR